MSLANSLSLNEENDFRRRISHSEECSVSCENYKLCKQTPDKKCYLKSDCHCKDEEDEKSLTDLNNELKFYNSRFNLLKDSFKKIQKAMKINAHVFKDDDMDFDDDMNFDDESEELF